MNMLRTLFLNNLGLKLTAVVLASVIWFQVASQQTVQRTVSIPVEIVKLPPNLAISNDYPKSVSVTVEARRGSLDESHASFVIDLAGAQPGERGVPVTADGIVMNKRAGLVKIITTTPSVINLNVEEIVHKRVPVEPVCTGSVAEDYELLRVTPVPSSIEISGPKSAVQQVDKAMTVAISVDDRYATFQREVAAFLKDDRVRVERDPKVIVVVQIEEKRRNVEFRQIPVQIFPGDPPARVRPETVRVTASVPLSFKEELSPEGFSAMIRTEGLDPRSEPYEVTPDVGDIIVPERYQSVLKVEKVTAVKVTRRP